MTVDYSLLHIIHFNTMVILNRSTTTLDIRLSLIHAYNNNHCSWWPGTE